MPGTETETMSIRCKNIARRRGWHRFVVFKTAACAGLLLLSFLSTPAVAKEFERPIKIGVISPYWENTPHLEGLREGLELLGYSEHVDFLVGVRFTSGDIAALPQAVGDLMAMGADILFADDTSAALAVKNIRSPLPLVFISPFDPVKAGLVESFAQPGGNRTGSTPLYLRLVTKTLETFTRILPGKKRFLFITSISNEIEYQNLGDQFNKILIQAGRILKIKLDIRSFSSQEEARRIFAAIHRKDVDGILSPNPMNNALAYSLEASRREKIPLMGSFQLTVEWGALASYGPDFHFMGRQSARLMDKIFRGEDPGKIPVEVTDRMRLVINLKVAKELGITIPSEMLFRADRIIR